jgi:hypothetical protein
MNFGSVWPSEQMLSIGQVVPWAHNSRAHMGLMPVQN